MEEKQRSYSIEIDEAVGACLLKGTVEEDATHSYSQIHLIALPPEWWPQAMKRLQRKGLSVSID